LLTLTKSIPKIFSMNYRKLIADSWEYTQNNKKLIRWFGFVPAVFTTTVGAWYVLYQFFAFKKSYIFNETDESFTNEVVGYVWVFINDHISWTIPLIIVAILFAISYLLLPTLAKASAIQMIARNKKDQKAGVGTGLRYGILSFLPLFEYHLLIKVFSFFSILFEMSFVVRNLGPVLFKIFLPVFMVFLLVGFILTLLFTYTDFYIVIDDKGVFESMKKSAKLVITHWKHTFLITLLMILIGIRVVIQAILVFLIPALFVLVAGYIATLALPFTALIVGGIVGLIVLIIASYLNGIVDIFSYTVWTFTFLKLSEEKEITARDIFVDDIGKKD